MLIVQKAHSLSFPRKRESRLTNFSTFWVVIIIQDYLIIKISTYIKKRVKILIILLNLQNMILNTAEFMLKSRRYIYVIFMCHLSL